MRTHVVLTRETIDACLVSLAPGWTGSAEAPEFREGRAGAWLDFRGAVRAWEDGSDACGHGHAPSVELARPAAPAPRAESTPPAGYAITGIDYEAHEEMAVVQIRRILGDLGEKYPLEAMLVIHRIGLVPVGEASLLVRILSGHRGEALQACAEFIDQLKTWVPIWKHPVPR